MTKPGGLSDMMERMAEAGAPMEAILIAVRAIEAEQEKLAESRAKGAKRKAEQRERERAERDSHETVTGQSVDSHSDSPPQKEKSPDPLKKNTNPLSKAKALAPHRLPDDFTVPDDWKDWARGERGWSSVEIDSEAANFVDYWIARGAGAAKRDWRRTWQTWVRNSKRADGPHRNARRASPEEVRDAQLRAAALYERMGRTEEAAEIRGRYGTGPPAVALSNAVASVMRRAAGSN